MATVISDVLIHLTRDLEPRAGDRIVLQECTATVLAGGAIDRSTRLPQMRAIVVADRPLDYLAIP